MILCVARLRHVVGTRWDTRKYLDMNRLVELEREQQAGQEDVLSMAV